MNAVGEESPSSCSSRRDPKRALATPVRISCPCKLAPAGIVFYLPRWIEHRRKIASLHREGLEGVGDLTLPHFDGEHYFDVYQNYVIRTKHRDKLRDHLKGHGIETLVSWPTPMWEHKGLGLENPGLPETESICSEVLSLPMSAETTPEHVRITVEAIREFFKGL